MKIIKSTNHMSQAEWLHHRTYGIGGSDAATVVNLNPYNTPFGLYLEKRGELEPAQVGEAAAWGNKLETLIADEFKERNGLTVRRKNAILQHDTHEFMIGNIDREIFDKERGRGVLEVKNNSFFTGKEWEGDAAPAQYVIQMQHYLAITGYEYGYYAVLIGGNRFHQIEIERDQEIIDYLIEAEAKFWEAVKTGTPPAIGRGEAEGDVLARLYPQATKADALPLSAQAADLTAEWQKLKALEKQTAASRAEVENKLKHMLGEHESGEIDSTLVSWKNVNSNRVDTKKLKAEYPEIYNNVVKLSSYRKFDVKEAK